MAALMVIVATATRFGHRRCAEESHWRITKRAGQSTTETMAAT
jgi:hypothetical protein